VVSDHSRMIAAWPAISTQRRMKIKCEADDG
jgi:hypothetical protein